MNLIKKITKEAKKHFKGKHGCHGFDHTMRVYKLGVHIGEKENADLEVIQIATLLHDIGRSEQDKCKGKVCHAEIGAKKAKEILKNYDITKEKLENITHCIETHRSRGSNIPETIEAKIVYDADKLDSIGAVGIGRLFLFAGEIGAKLHNKDADIENTKEYSKDDTAYREFLIKKQKVKDKMLTEEGKKIAIERHEYMVQFFDRLNMEVDGEI
ncbi:MAG: HD domain-containing protein [Candidatus Gracilibacteria bacterium]